MMGEENVQDTGTGNNTIYFMKITSVTLKG